MRKALKNTWFGMKILAAFIGFLTALACIAYVLVQWIYIINGLAPITPDLLIFSVAGFILTSSIIGAIIDPYELLF